MKWKSAVFAYSVLWQTQWCQNLLVAGSNSVIGWHNCSSLPQIGHTQHKTWVLEDEVSATTLPPFAPVTCEASLSKSHK